MKEWALKYRALGLSVIPLRPKSKEPLIPWTEFQMRLATEAEIEEWFTKTPTANLGIVTGGVSNLVVVDLDGPEGLGSSHRLRLWSPITALTGNGQQLFYRHPGQGGKVCNSVKKVAPGIDIRGDGGYVCAPPSMHPNGKMYAWKGSPISATSLPPLPPMFMESKTVYGDQTNGIRKPADWIATALKEMKRGNIDNTLTSVLGRLRRDGFSEGDAHMLLAPHAERAGATAGHLDDKIKNIWARYPAVQSPEVGSVAHRAEAIDDFLQDIKKVEWICEPLIAKKSIGFVAGLPETRKTWLLIDLAIECARDSGLWLGIFATSAAKVLFIDQERFKGETQRRFNAMIAAKGLSRGELRDRLFIKCGTTIKLDLDASFQAFRSELLELRPDVVVVDSFTTFHNSPENDRTEIQKVLEKIKQLRTEIGCTFLFVNHETKQTFQDADQNIEPSMMRMAGSVAVGAAAEFCLTVRKLDDNRSMVFHTKSTLAPKIQAFTIEMFDVDNGVVVRGIDG